MTESTDNSKNSATLTEQDFNLLSQASDEFQRKRYAHCLQTLSQLEKSTGSNDKIRHNKAVVQFFANDCKDYQTLLKFLDEDIAQADDNPEDGKCRNMNMAHYNKAVILFHIRKPFAALEILEPISKRMAELDEPLKTKIGLLMLVLLLSTNQHNKGNEFLEYFQNCLSTPSDLFPSDEGLSASNASGDLSSSGRMLKLISMLTEILNRTPVTIPDDGSVEFTFLKAHQYYLGKDFQMAAKQLSRQFTAPRFSAEINGDDQDVCLANNMGVIHLRVRHYAIAAQFFQHAIQFDNKITENIKNTSILNVGASKKPEILYNLGIALLHLQRPKEAFECLLIPLKVYQNNPRLWLRVAEACIMLHEKTQKATENNTVVSSVIGSGIYRKFLIAPSPKLLCAESGQTFAIPNPNLEFAALCLRNAVALAEYYRGLFISETDPTAAEDPNDDLVVKIEKEVCNPSPPISKESFNRLLSAIYTSYSYVCIRLGDFTIALEYAKLLLQLENLSDEMNMLGHLYCAEALIMLDRVNEARTYLDQNFISNLNPHDFETKDWQINSMEAAQSVLRYNLAVTLVLQGELSTAKTVLSSCIHPVVSTKFKLLKMYMELAMGNIR